MSFLYARGAGEIKKVFEAFDLLNLPNPQENTAVLKKKIHPLDFLFDAQSDIETGKGFNYFKYVGSNT